MAQQHGKAKVNGGAKMVAPVLKKHRVVVVDDHVSVREMVGTVLHLDGRYEVVGEAGTGWEALKVCAKVKPDLAIVDLVLPELSGVEVVRRMRSGVPNVRVIVYSGTVHATLAAEALKAMPHGYVHKQDSLATLRDAVRTVAEGSCYFCGFAATLLHSPPQTDKDFASLTECEKVVLQMVAEGWQTKEIAGRLNVSGKTVERHRMHLMKKLERRDVAGLTRVAVKHGLVLPE